jgi:acyl-coenzyme A synthetase/AMP-(fatty) acid ligase
VDVDNLLRTTSLGGWVGALIGRSVLVATSSQIATAAALVELDGIAARLVLVPGDLSGEDLKRVVAKANVTAIVSDHDAFDGIGVSGPVVRCTPAALQTETHPPRTHQTEWVLLTSGTTDGPKLVAHTLASLTGAISPANGTEPPVWSTFYDTRRYGGLQILLRVLIGGGSLVIAASGEAVGDFLVRIGKHKVTHISGTPSHWRRVLMSPFADRIAPRIIRLTGEIADQALLDKLIAFYEPRSLVHAFASTEAGVAFEVSDGLEGFPVDFLGRHGAVELKIEGGSLQVRSQRTARCYLGGGELAGKNGWIDTGDLLERRGSRYYFIGRRGGVINVGGLKVHPEEVEAVINSHPRVLMSRVRPRRSAITGGLVVAEVIAQPRTTVGRDRDLEAEILDLCRKALSPYKVPAQIRLVPSLDVAASGKMVRSNA